MGKNFTLPAPVAGCCSALRQAGYQAFPVGGCVRDLLLGRSPEDWDVTTSASPEEILACFPRAVLTGGAFGTVTVLTDGVSIEVTPFRTETGYSDGRHPDGVVFVSTLEEDLARRDFTVNAMALDEAGRVVDPFGGQADLARKLIRCVGDPDRRFSEDALRLLRALRFAAVRSMGIEEHTAAALHDCRSLMSRVATERIYAELTRLICGSDAGEVLRCYADVLAVPIPELAPLVGFDQRNPHHCHDAWGHTAAVVAAAPPEPVLRWAALFHDLGKPGCFTLDPEGVGHFYGHAPKSAELAAAVMDRLRFDNATRAEVLFLVAHHDDRLQPTERSVKRAIQDFGVRRLRLLMALFRADALGHSPDPARRRLEVCAALEALTDRLAGAGDRFTVRDLAVRGEDLLALGYRGPALGAALDALVEAVVFDGLENKKEALLDFLAGR